MATDLLELSARIIDGTIEGEIPRTNRVTGELSELADGIAIVEAFSHVIAFNTGDGLVIFDVSGKAWGEPAVKALREWTNDRFATIVYTHGHLDHVGGGGAFLADAEQRGDPAVKIVGHENVPPRFDRYKLTEGYNNIINLRQFGAPRMAGQQMQFSQTWARPQTTYSDNLSLRIGDLEFQLRHGKGETDDHTWAWVPERRAILAGDFLTWVFPNAGNPQKVQRYPLEWAKVLREMAGMNADLFLPAHGLPIAGPERIASVLHDAANALDILVTETLRMMNEGARLDDILHTVKVPDDLLDRPFLRPVYDEPDFVVRNVWRMYGGWYDGNPARLKPVRDAVLATEVASLAGGVDALVDRASELAESKSAEDHSLACHLIEMAVQAAPDDKRAHRVRAEVYKARRAGEISLMSRGIYGAVIRESEELAGGE